jgi:hypothetical protein
MAPSLNGILRYGPRLVHGTSRGATFHRNADALAPQPPRYGPQEKPAQSEARVAAVNATAVQASGHNLLTAHASGGINAGRRRDARG